jgi:UDP-N-acetylglucosamine transferase subunit ALG13
MSYILDSATVGYFMTLCREKEKITASSIEQHYLKHMDDHQLNSNYN